MNTVGLSMLFRSCVCMRDAVEISGTKYSIIERIAVGKITKLLGAFTLEICLYYWDLK